MYAYTTTRRLLFSVFLTFPEAAPKLCRKPHSYNVYSVYPNVVWSGEWKKELSHEWLSAAVRKSRCVITLKAESNLAALPDNGEGFHSGVTSHTWVTTLWFTAESINRVNGVAGHWLTTLLNSPMTGQFISVQSKRPQTSIHNDLKHFWLWGDRCLYSF